jgi:PhzF family phenazine biosynthesis protein
MPDARLPISILILSCFIQSMKLPIYQIDAFADAPFKGNPAAVCPLKKWLPDNILQSIAEENNLAETAFYVKKGSHYHLRWFTPTTEVDLCGHATVAAAFVLFEFENFKGKEITFDSRSGELRVAREKNLITLDFPKQTITPCKIPNQLTEALGVKPRELYRGMDYMAVFNHEDDVIAIKPNFNLFKGLDLRGVIVTAPGEKVDFVSRFFAPNFGINEDPVTGSAHCALAPYWSEKLKKNPLTARQLSKRGGSLRCEVKGDRVFISGKAVPYLEGFIHV